MASLRQHYESIKGNKDFIGGTLGIALGISGLVYGVANYVGKFIPEPTEKYARVIEIENELNKNLRVGNVKDELLDRVRFLRTELDDLNSEQEVIDERQESERKQAIARNVATYATFPTAISLVSVFLFSSGDLKRRRKLRELTGKQ